MRALAVLTLTLAAACTPVPHGVKWVDAPAGTRDIAAQVREAEARARAEKRRLVVYVGATWCEPCQVIHAAALGGKLDAEFPDLEILAFDLDRDREALARAGYASRLIPLFVLPEADGRAGSQRAEGGIKGDGNFAYLTAKLRKLLAR